MSAVFSMISPLLVAFLVGIFCASFFPVAFLGAYTFIALSLVFLCGAYFFPYRTRLIFGAILCLGLASGIFRFALWESVLPALELSQRVGTAILLTGVVVGEPDVREKTTLLTVRLRELDGLAIGGSREQILVSTTRYPEYHYGDVLRLHGKLTEPQKFSGSDGRVFDYPSYLATKGIRYQMAFAKIEHAASGEGNSIVAALFRVKRAFTASLARVFPEPHNALLNGLLLGGKQSLGEEWIERFRIAGIVHIIVLSGYNMTLIAQWLVISFRFLGFFGSLTAGGVGIVLFAIMTGGGATVLRAAVMALLALLARATGRTATMGRALLIAGALMVLHNPSILAFDPSFQLSFLASLGLVFIAPCVEVWGFVRRLRPWSLLHEILVATLATQIAVLPLLLLQTGLFSLVALPTNLLVLPAIPLTMFFGFIAALFAFVVPILGVIVGFPAYILLSWMLFIAAIASQLPFAALSIAGMTPIVVTVLYGLLTLWLWHWYRREASIKSFTYHDASLPVQSPEVPPSRLTSGKIHTQ